MSTTDDRSPVQRFVLAKAECDQATQQAQAATDRMGREYNDAHDYVQRYGPQVVRTNGGGVFIVRVTGDNLLVVEAAQDAT